MNFTPYLAQLRQNHAQAHELLEDMSMVICMGSRALLSYVVAACRQPHRILGAATTEAEGLELLTRSTPDLLYVSDRLEAGCGISLAVSAKRLYPETRTLLLVTQERRQPNLKVAIDACCDGVLMDSGIGMGNALTAIRSICGGGIYLDRRLSHAMRSGDGRRAHGALASLSSREIEVLQRVACGEKNSEIAANLIISVDTVKTHLRNLLAKLQARDRTHAAVIAVTQGLVEWPEAWHLR